MARPKDDRFYEFPLPDKIPKSQKWLIRYHENSRQLVEYMEQQGAGQTMYYSTIQCLQRFRNYLLDNDLCYTYAESIRWLDSTRPYPKGFRIVLLRLSDIYEYGAVQPINAFPVAIPYSKLLQKPWSGLLREYLNTLDFLESYVTDIRNRIARFLYTIQLQGVLDPSEITFELIEQYCLTDVHRSKEMDAIYTYSIGDFLLYMADKRLCSHGLGWYPYFRMHNRIFDINDFTDEQRSIIKRYKDDSLDFPTEEYAVAAEGFLSEYNKLGYSKSPCKIAAYTLHNLLLFLEMNSLGYHKEIAAVWLDHEKTYHDKRGWAQASRALYLFEVYTREGCVMPQALNITKPLRCEALPDWCTTEMDAYLAVKSKEGWAPSTINMIRSAVTRFCEHLTDSGLDGFEELNASVIKEFNLSDHHDTPEGKNAYNVRIRKFLKYLERKKIIPYGLNEALLCSAENRERIVVTLTDNEKQHIKERQGFCRSSIELRDNAMMLLGLKMGIRSIDIVNLKLDDIDWKNQYIQIYQKKTSHEIILPMPTDVGNAIYLYIANGRANEKTSCRYLFIKNRVPYDSLQRCVCRQALKRMLPERNTPGSGFHVTRRTYATDQLRKGTGKQGLADLLGHRDTTSIKHYLNLDEERMRMCPISLSDSGLLMEGGRYDEV